MIKNRPKVTNIMLSSLDGKIAITGDESTQIRVKNGFTNKDDFKHLLKQVSLCDAVIIGYKSIESETNVFTVSHLKKNKQDPHWFVCAQSPKYEFKSKFWSDERFKKKLIILNKDKNFLPKLKDNSYFNRIQTIEYGIYSLLKDLKTLGYKKIALLGGGLLNGYFWENNLVDELHLTICPFIVGLNSAPQNFISDNTINKKLKLVSLNKKSNFIFLHYKTKK